MFYCKYSYCHVTFGYIVKLCLQLELLNRDNNVISLIYEFT